MSIMLLVVTYLTKKISCFLTYLFLPIDSVQILLNKCFLRLYVKRSIKEVGILKTFLTNNS